MSKRFIDDNEDTNYKINNFSDYKERYLKELKILTSKGIYTRDSNSPIYDRDIISQYKKYISTKIQRKYLISYLLYKPEFKDKVFY